MYLAGWRTDVFLLFCLEELDGFLYRIVALVPNKYMAMPTAWSALKGFDPTSPLMSEVICWFTSNRAACAAALPDAHPAGLGCTCYSIVPGSTPMRSAPLPKRASTLDIMFGDRAVRTIFMPST
jgi:hypothetical protein